MRSSCDTLLLQLEIICNTSGILFIIESATDRDPYNIFFYDLLFRLTWIAVNTDKHVE